MRRFITLLLVLATTLVACGDDDTAGTTTTTLPDGSVIAEFRTPDGETYRTLLSGDAAERARQAFESGEAVGIPNGRIQPGDGGVNIGHDWHVTDVEFADITIEVCDGTVSYVDELGHDEFVSQHGDRFCPWGATLVDLVEP
jgi:hypothetical protein